MQILSHPASWIEIINWLINWLFENETQNGWQGGILRRKKPMHQIASKNEDTIIKTMTEEEIYWNPKHTGKNNGQNNHSFNIMRRGAENFLTWFTSQP